MSNVPPPPPGPEGQPQGAPPPPPMGAPAAQPPPAGAMPGGQPPAQSGGLMEPGGLFSPRFQMSDPPPPGWSPKSKITAGIIAILIGGLGIHAFYLGNTKKGIYILLSNLLCLGGIWGLIDGIMILTDKETTDAYGVPLTQ